MRSIREHYDKTWLLRFGIGAITLYPHILYAVPEADLKSVIPEMRRHEWQHVSQIRTVGWFHFYVSYLWQVVKLVVTLKFKDMHDHITWEKDAILHQYDSTWPANTPDHP